MFVLALLAGCSGTDFDDPEHARTWANTGSAFAVFIPAAEALYQADDEGFEDPACPAVFDDGERFEAVGDCVASDGTAYEGTLVVDRVGEDRYLEWVDWGYQLGGGGPVRNGSAALEVDDEDGWVFEVAHVTEHADVLDVDYAGAITGLRDGSGEATYSGSGRIERRGADHANGLAEVETVEQHRSDVVCAHESASGRSFFRVDGQTLEIVYDGAVDCDEAQTVQYAVDGEDRGELDGVGCAHRSGAVLGGLIPLAVMAMRRRRG